LAPNVFLHLDERETGQKQFHQGFSGTVPNNPGNPQIGINAAPGIVSIGGINPLGHSFNLVVNPLLLGHGGYSPFSPVISNVDNFPLDTVDSRRNVNQPLTDNRQGTLAITVPCTFFCATHLCHGAEHIEIILHHFSPSFLLSGAKQTCEIAAAKVYDRSAQLLGRGQNATAFLPVYVAVRAVRFTGLPINRANDLLHRVHSFAITQVFILES